MTPHVDPVTWAGRVAVVDAPAYLQPSRCLICGTADDVHSVCKDYQDAPLTALARESESVTLSLCGRCDRRWRASEMFYLLTVGVGLLVLPLAFGFWADTLRVEYVDLFGTWVGFLVWLLAVVVVRITLVLPRQIRCVRLQRKTVSLDFPNPELAREVLAEAEAAQLSEAASG